MLLLVSESKEEVSINRYHIGRYQGFRVASVFLRRRGCLPTRFSSFRASLRCLIGRIRYSSTLGSFLNVGVEQRSRPARLIIDVKWLHLKRFDTLTCHDEQQMETA